MGLVIGTVLQSIFLDVLLVISAPLARKLAAKIGQLGTARMPTAMAVALECGIVFTVLGVASFALAGLLNVPLGKMLLFGLLLVIATILISIAIMTFLFHRGFWDEERMKTIPSSLKKPVKAKKMTKFVPAAGATVAGPTRNSSKDGAELEPGTVAVAKRGTKQFPLLVLFAALLVSLLLIGASAILQVLDIQMPWLQLLGEPVIPLLIGVIGTCLVTRSAVGQSRIEGAIIGGYKESGQILILTGVGGCLAATVAAAGLAWRVLLRQLRYLSPGGLGPCGRAPHRIRRRRSVRHHHRRAAGPRSLRRPAWPRVPGPLRWAPVPSSWSTSPATPCGSGSPPWAEVSGGAQIDDCGSLGGVRRRDPPDPAHESAVLI